MSETGTTREDRVTSAPGLGRAANIVLWSLQALLAIMFAMAGASKIFGEQGMVEMFVTIGIGQWFRYAVGALEIAGALGVLVPRLSGLAALGLVGLMAGAAATNAFVLGASPLLPLALLLVGALVAWGRQGTTAKTMKGEAMADDGNTNDAQGYGGPAEPAEDLKALDRLVGPWELSGDMRGTVTYEWTEGGFFLIQRVALLQEDGTESRGMEVIGHERPLGAEPSADIKSRFYSGTGETLDYTYELLGNTLTIWFGDRGSPAYYEGTLSEDGNVLTGAWHWPGGGYEAISTRTG